MGNKDELIHVFTGSDVEVAQLVAELEAKGIKALIRNDFQSGVIAGFGGGVPSGIDIFVNSSDAEKAQEIVNTIMNTDIK